MRVLLLLALAAVLASGCGSSTPSPNPMRAIWVTRWDYVDEADVRRIVADCADAGFGTILFQVRGNATAFYASSYEPWAEQLGWRDPGFDPLALAVELAHERGLELHAWVNVVPAWWGPEPPENPEHVYHTHPEWFWYDADGQRQALSDDFYVSLNPCLPAVRDYLVDVMREIVATYDVDGLHLDYIRFPNEPPATPAGSEIDYPRDERTIELFRAASGMAPDQNPPAWDAWRAAQVSQLVRQIRRAVREEDPGLCLSAAVGPDDERALHHFQNTRTWLAEGLLERVFPMNYTADAALFDERLERWAERDANLDTDVVLGLMIGTGDLEQRCQQVLAANERLGAFALFGYASLFDSENETIDRQDEAARRARAERRERLLPLLRGL